MLIGLSRVLILAFACLGGCASTTMRTSDFDQSCTSDSQCVAVFEGDSCNVCCNDGAINGRDQRRYEQELERARSACGDEIMECEPCMQSTAVCQRGRCVVPTRSNRGAHSSAAVRRARCAALSSP
ncbi:MAG: hypothetical protein IT377_06520 [Polyangiaceae bacterium]|nr:hypothetical protein [Polyangiaceae bacterium]